jgi:hypothetical protein
MAVYKDQLPAAVAQPPPAPGSPFPIWIRANLAEYRHELTGIEPIAFNWSGCHLTSLKRAPRKIFGGTDGGG